MPRKVIKLISFLLCVCLLFQQSGFAQVAGQLDISAHLAGLRNSFIQDKFRPMHLRYLSYDPLNNNFRLLLDKGDFEKAQGLSPSELKGTLSKGTVPNLENATRELLNYFFVGISLPNDSFWVNLRPDSENEVIDPELGKTDVGKILLEADLQLKKDTAQFTSPETLEGKKYWAQLYKKAEELFGYENITIPTLTRPWIVPDEIIIRETQDNAYIYKATLKVMLEQDYLKDSSTYNFKDPRLKALNEYSSQLIRELIIPKLTKEINTSKRYAPLRQVYYSLILAQWFKQRFYGKGGLYSWLIDKKNLNGLTSKTPWSKTTYFQAYQKSFKEGEYNLKEPTYTPYGQTIRSYMSGGIGLQDMQSAIGPHGAISGKKPFNFFKGFLASILVLGATNIAEPAEVKVALQERPPLEIVAGLAQSNAPKVMVQQAEQAQINKTVEEKVRDILYSSPSDEPEAVEKLVALGKPAVPYLIEAIKDYLYPRIAARALGRLKDPRATEALIEALKNIKYPFDLLPLINALGEIGDPKAFKPLLNLLRKNKFLYIQIAGRDALIALAVDYSRSDPVVKDEIIPILIRYLGLSTKLNTYTPVMQRFLVNILYRIAEIEYGAFNPQDIFLIYSNDNFIQLTEKLDFANQFSVARATQLTLMRYGYSITNENINKILPFIIQIRENSSAFALFSPDKHFIIAMHEDADMFNFSVISDFLRFFKADIRSFRGKKEKESIINTIINSPLNTMIWLWGHGGPNHFWLLGGEAGKETSGLLTNPNAISYKELSNALISRAKSNNGRLSDLTLIVDSCFSADFIVKTLDALKEAVSKGEIKDLPIIITSTNRKIVALGAIGGSSALIEGFKSAHEESVDKTKFTVGEAYKAEKYIATKEDLAMFLPLSNEDLQRLKDILGVSVKSRETEQEPKKRLSSQKTKQSSTYITFGGGALDREKPTSLDPSLPILDGSFEGDTTVVPQEDFDRVWKKGEYIVFNDGQLKMLQDPVMGPDFRVPLVRLVSREEMDSIPGAQGKNVVRNGDKVAVERKYWDSLLGQQKLDLLMHEAMADWLERKGIDAGDVAIDIEGLKVDEAKRRAQHSAGVDYNMEGDGVSPLREQKIKETRSRVLFKDTEEDTEEIAYVKPIKLTLSPNMEGSLTLWIYKFEDIPDTWPVKYRINRNVGYFIVKENGPADEYKGLRDGEEVILGRYNPGRFEGFGSGFISRSHVKISRKKDTIVIEDTSTHGTLLEWVEGVITKQPRDKSVQQIREMIGRENLPCTNGRKDLVLLNGRVADERLNEIEDKLVNGGAIDQSTEASLKKELEEIRQEVSLILQLFNRFSNPRYWERLDLPRGADNNRIKQQYRKLMLEFHPDRYGNDERPHPISQHVAAEIAKLIGEAHKHIYSPLAEPGKGPGGGSRLESPNNKVKEAEELLNQGEASEARNLLKEAIEVYNAIIKDEKDASEGTLGFDMWKAAEKNLEVARELLKQAEEQIKTPLPADAKKESPPADAGEKLPPANESYSRSQSEAKELFASIIQMVNLAGPAGLYVVDKGPLSGADDWGDVLLLRWTIEQYEMGNITKGGLAWLIAHEVAHLEKRHPVEMWQLKNSLLPMIVRGIAVPTAIPAWAPKLQEVSKEGIQKRFKEMENEADMRATELIIKIGFSLEDAISIISKLEDLKAQAIKEGKIEVKEESVKGHPDVNERVQYVLNNINVPATEMPSPAEQEPPPADTEKGSPPAAGASNSDKGGIDFRGLPIVTQPMQTPLGTVILGATSKELWRGQSLNLDEEWSQIERMLNSEIIPSSQRIKEYLERSCSSQDCSERIDRVLSGIADILRLEEERVSATEPALREMLVLLESDKPASAIQTALSKITVAPKEPALVK